ncbi:hypothetical protein [Prauserella marina]|uniref:hypothetical protein n=1 Tax=Prauserella marina TaxID=530584 RepID=UPI0011B72905|nr:hypothetical protein [Prauserella marina]
MTHPGLSSALAARGEHCGRGHRPDDGYSARANLAHGRPRTGSPEPGMTKSTLDFQSFKDDKGDPRRC